MTTGVRRWAALAAIALGARAARADDAFEIQVYDGTADPPGHAGLEVHLNHVAIGTTTAPPPELPANHQTHLTLEPSFGVLPTWEVGGYLMTALLPDGTYQVAGGKLRSKLVTPPGTWAHARLGVNVEVAWARAAYDPARWSFELRPIAAWESRYVLLAVNPIVGVSPSDGSAAFAPAAMAVVQLPGLMSVGVEYYADLGGLAHPAPVRDQPHYLFAVANLLCVRGLELNVGVGQGLTAASSPLVLKTIVGFGF